MEQLSSLDLFHLIKEFKDVENSKVENIYQKNGTLFLVLHTSGKGKSIIKIMLPSFIYMTKYKEEMPTIPPHFCMLLRKYLKNSRLESIEQMGFERVVRFGFRKKDDNFFLVIELFSKGNAILCNKDMKIIYPMTHQKLKDRKIKGGQMYNLPEKTSKLNPLEAEEDKIKKVLEESDNNKLVICLAKEFSLGGKHSEKICEKAGLDKNSIPKSNAENAGKIKKAIKEIKEDKNNLNELLDKELTEKVMKEEKIEREKEGKAKRTKVEKILEAQKSTEDKQKKIIDESNMKGDYIYSNYSKIKEIIENIKKAREELSWKEIKERLKGNKTIKKIDEKHSKIIIDI